jgi:hypothetical protein
LASNQRAQRGSVNPKRRAYLHGFMKRRQLMVGARYLGYAKTDDQAQAIRAHIKERLSELKSRQSTRAEAEGISAGGVSAQASHRAD